MTSKEVSDKELDAMIDASVKQSKGGKPNKETEQEKEPAKVKQETQLVKEDVSKSKPSDVKGPKGAKKAKTGAALKPVEGYDPWTVLNYPHLTEKSMNLVERGNVLVFIVDIKADKQQIKEAVEKGFGARVVSVKVEITRKNQKKAYVRLAEGVLASDIATRLGMI